LRRAGRWWSRPAGASGYDRRKNRAGQIEITITPSPTTDTKDGSYRKTTVDLEQHVIDAMGDQEFIVGVITALNLDGTNERSAFLKAKVF